MPPGSSRVRRSSIVPIRCVNSVTTDRRKWEFSLATGIGNRTQAHTATLACRADSAASEWSSIRLSADPSSHPVEGFASGSGTRTGSLTLAAIQRSTTSASRFARAPHLAPASFDARRFRRSSRRPTVNYRDDSENDQHLYRGVDAAPIQAGDDDVACLAFERPRTRYRPRPSRSVMVCGCRRGSVPAGTVGASTPPANHYWSDMATVAVATTAATIPASWHRASRNPDRGRPG